MKTFTTIYFWNNPLKIHTEALIFYSFSLEDESEVRSEDDVPALEFSLIITLIFVLGFASIPIGICSTGAEADRGIEMVMEEEREGWGSGDKFGSELSSCNFLDKVSGEGTFREFEGDSIFEPDCFFFSLDRDLSLFNVEEGESQYPDCGATFFKSTFKFGDCCVER